MSAIAASQRTATAIRTIGIAARDPRARVRLAGALAMEPDLRVCVGPSARLLVAAGDADDLLVLHVDGVGADELSLIAELNVDAPDLPIVAVCETIDRRRARRAIDGGLDGLVLADHIDSALVPTIAAVLAGQTSIPRSLRSSLRAPALSCREKQVLGMVVMGFTNGEIASRLFVAESTVKSHLSAAFRKLGVQSRSEAASLILDPNGSLGPGILAITPTD